ncbi:GntR family transcriptional regulator [uncultured Ruminococcus sp.]|uniref:GntR family transcriptional regulator n=1 Tax=uncultured Ruminococcus sp. TaxID=165186 RepID=UPI0025E366A5|nr:GntR family transcriptional regulator [uncultured Ruminococcus sp.]
MSSLISLDLTGRAPIYEQICQRISELIATGVLKENDKLPGARTMAKDLGLNPNTVAKAYSRLELNGIIYSVAGKGCFVAKQQGSIQKKLLDEFDEKAQAALNAGVSAEQLCKRIEKIENIAQQKEKKDSVEKGEGNIDSDQ